MGIPTAEWFINVYKWKILLKWMRTGGTPMDWKLPSCLTCCRCFYSWETWGHRKRPIDRVDFPLKNMWNLANVAEELGDKYYAMLHCGKKTTWERTDSLGSAHGSRVTSSIPHVQTWFMTGSCVGNLKNYPLKTMSRHIGCPQSWRIWKERLTWWVHWFMAMNCIYACDTVYHDIST